MAHRRSLSSGPRGGAGISALRPARARLITGICSLSTLAAVAAYAVAATPADLRAVTATLEALAFFVLAVGVIARWPTALPWAIVLCGAGYIAAREGRAAVDGWAAAVGVGLLLTAELATWSIQHDRRVRSEPALVLRRVLTLGGLLVGGGLVTVLIVASAGLTASTGAVIAAAGVAAAVSAVALVLRLARG